MKCRALLLSFLAMSVLFAAPVMGAGQAPSGPLGGNVYVSSRPFPVQIADHALSGGSAALDLQHLAETRFVESKDHSWTIYFVSYVNMKAENLVYDVEVYDVSGRVPARVVMAPQRAAKRGEQIVVSSFTIDANHPALVGKHLMVKLTTAGQERDMASAEFVLLPAQGPTSKEK